MRSLGSGPSGPGGPAMADPTGQQAQLSQGLGTSTLPGLMDPTNRPDEPVTAGADAGAGIGMAAAGITPPKGPDVADEVKPVMARLHVLAGLNGTTPETRTWVRQLVTRLGGTPLR